MRHASRPRPPSGLGLTQIVGWGTTFLMPSVLGRHIEHDLGLPSEVVYGGITVMFGVGALFAPWVGRLIDRTGARSRHGRGLDRLRAVARRARLLAGTRELSPVLGRDGHRLDPGAEHAGQHRAGPGRGRPRAPGDRRAGHRRRLRLDRVLAGLGGARTPRRLARHAADLCRDPSSGLRAGPSADAARPAVGRHARRGRPAAGPVGLGREPNASSCCSPSPSPAAPSSSPASSCTRSACCAAWATIPPRPCCWPR